MQLRLYKNFNKRRNSTKRPSGGSVVEVFLKSDTSIESPTFLIDGIDIDVNYCSAFGHYYYIDDIRLNNDNIYELVCSQDVLATYKTEIGNTSAYIERSASEFNEFFNDNLISMTQDVIHCERALTDVTGLEGGSGCFVLRVTGGTDRGITTYVAQSLSAFGKIFNKDSYIFESEATEAIGLLIFNPFDYIVSLSWSPINWNLFSAYGTEQAFIDIKWYTLFLSDGNTVIRLNDLATYSSQVNVNKPNPYYDDFRAYNPAFTNYNIYIPAIGEFPLAPEYTKNDILIDFIVDLSTGDVHYNMNFADDSGQSSIAVFDGCLYRQLQIGNDAVSLSNVMGSFANAVEGTVSTGVGGIGGIVDTITNIMTPVPSRSGGDGASIGVKEDNQVICSQFVHGSGGLITELLGRPLNEIRTIGTLSGYVKCGGASIDLSGLGNDKDAVNGYLNSGFYFE